MRGSQGKGGLDDRRRGQGGHGRVDRLLELEQRNVTQKRRVERVHLRYDHLMDRVLGPLAPHDVPHADRLVMARARVRVRVSVRVASERARTSPEGEIYIYPYRRTMDSGSLIDPSAKFVTQCAAVSRARGEMSTAPQVCTLP